MPVFILFSFLFTCTTMHEIHFCIICFVNLLLCVHRGIKTKQKHIELPWTASHDSDGPNWSGHSRVKVRLVGLVSSSWDQTGPNFVPPWNRAVAAPPRLLTLFPKPPVPSTDCVVGDDLAFTDRYTPRQAVALSSQYMACVKTNSSSSKDVSILGFDRLL